jgi:hypothetical protein
MIGLLLVSPLVLLAIMAHLQADREQYGLGQELACEAGLFWRKLLRAGSFRWPGDYRRAPGCWAWRWRRA